MNVRLKPRSNGDTARPQWVEDDEKDQLEAISRLAEDTAGSTIPSAGRSESKRETPVPQPPAKPKETVNAKELIEVLVSAYMAADADRVTIEVRNNEILVEQIVDEDGARFKHTWAIGVSHYRVSSRKLIK